ncbi:MAG: PIG-L family deacetylase, partial [Candidatus Omnitrophica bacterium]|nr:PIG-L family deacetylase [Candidatus Omnitrophota bacterium]
MRKYKISTILLFLLLAGCASIEKPDQAYWPRIPDLEPFKKGERVLILSPHPDDEAIACAGVIQRALEAGAKIKIVYLTNGDHNELAFIVYEKRITVRQGEFV